MRLYAFVSWRNLVAALVVAFVYVLHRFRRSPAANVPPPRWGLRFFTLNIACLSQFCSISPTTTASSFLAVSGRWYSGHRLHHRASILVLLIGGLVAPVLGSLIKDEIGVRRQGLPGSAARVALAGILLTWGIRDYEHRRRCHRPRVQPLSE